MSNLFQNNTVLKSIFQLKYDFFPMMLCAEPTDSLSLCIIIIFSKKFGICRLHVIFTDLQTL
jgi:hypothetical protein